VRRAPIPIAGGGYAVPDSPWMTPRETADYLRISLNSFYKAVEKGQIPAKRIGRRIRVDRRSLDASLHAQRVA